MHIEGDDLLTHTQERMTCSGHIGRDDRLPQTKYSWMERVRDPSFFPMRFSVFTSWPQGIPEDVLLPTESPSASAQGGLAVPPSVSWLRASQLIPRIAMEAAGGLS